MNIIDAIESAKIFARLFKDPETWQTWIVCLKAIFGLPMTKKELKTFRKFTGRKKRPDQQFKEIFLAIGRRGGKSFISALIAVFLAVFKDWRSQLSRGEIGYIVLIASDRKQASVLMNYIKAFLKLPVFKGMIKNETREEIECTNGITIAVMTCSYRSIRGFSIVASICDEISFWRDFGANPDHEILNAIRPAMANISGSMLICISTTYARSGILWEQFQRFGREDPDVLMWCAGTQDMNPEFKKSVIKRALKEDFASARSEYFSDFRADLETFLSVESIDACVIPNRLELPKEKTRFDYIAFCDPSSGRHDAMSLSICHREKNDVIIQDLIRWKNPPFDPQNVVKEFAEILESYACGKVIGDRYAVGFVVAEFQKRRITYQPSELSKSEIYLEFLPLIMTKRVELCDTKEQTIEFRSLERRTGANRDSVDHPKFASDDIANACAGAVVHTVRKDSKGVYFGFSKTNFPFLDGDRTIQEMPDKSAREKLNAEERKKPIITTNRTQPK